MSNSLVKWLGIDLGKFYTEKPAKDAAKTLDKYRAKQKQLAEVKRKKKEVEEKTRRAAMKKAKKPGDGK